MSTSTRTAPPADWLDFDDFDAAIEHCYASGWTDGLPILLPTEKRVRQILDAVPRDPLEVVGIVPPGRGIATVEKIAINAAMAGCLPQHFPVVLAAVEAMLEPIFNLNGVQATTHMCSPLVVVSGPAVRELDFNAGGNTFGGGSRANAGVGRAVRLVMWNVGGGKPGINDKATFGSPAKFAYCIAENPDTCPWEPLHVERGIAATDSAVTVFACESPHNISDYQNDTPAGVLGVIADALSTASNNVMDHGGEVLVALGQEHARIVASQGLSRADARRLLWELARRPLGDLFRVRRGLLREWPDWIDKNDLGTRVPVVDDPANITLTVAGGPGPHSVCCPGWGHYGGFAVSRKIQLT
ncbi:MAG: hypothetical protein HY329_02950 [Chloroflexi bacterium]|nr:hypothetical protein [Chloroflexota bacterium]